MPIPKPKKDETKDDFIDRCMGNEAMKEEFPDNDQRLAVCHDSWDKEKEKKSKSKENMPENIEYRTFTVEEFRVLKEDDHPKIVGYAALFNKESEPIKFFGTTFTEEIAPGAFKKAIKKSDTRATFNHDPNIILGRKSAGTLNLKEDEKGLFTETTPPDTQYVRDVVLTPIDRGDIKEMSFAFTVKIEKFEEDKDKNTVKRTLVEVDYLYDIAPVTYPAYKDTSVALRSLEKWREDNKGSLPEPTGVNSEGLDEIKPAEAGKVVEDLEKRLQRAETRVRKLEVEKL